MQFQLINNKINPPLHEEKIASEDRHEISHLSDLVNEKNIISEKKAIVDNKPFNFQTNFQGYMEMYCDSDRVEKYLDCHQNWFQNCAKPMVAKPLGDSGYSLTVGRFGSFGYEVEAKIDVVMRSPQKGRYVMETINTPEDRSLGYKVDYQAALQLCEINTNSIVSRINNKKLISQLPDRITRVEWELNLGVAVKFPKFIYKLPCSVIQNTGDRLLTQIVRQISPLLSSKVQKDFHSSHNLPIPGRNSRNCQKIAKRNLIATGTTS
ncbi:MAG: DUF1997 domain-containing protein [Prochloraceae cyanobacterium]